MKLKIVLICSVFLLTGTALLAQDTVLLAGKVLNDTIDKSSLNVVNLSKRKGTTTRTDGTFELEVSVNDTVNISAIQYESRQFVVNQTMFNRKRISLYLIPKINQLQEVEISNIDLSGNLSKDATLTKGQPQLYPEDLGLPRNTAPKRTVEERRYYTAVTSGSGIPLDGLINAITGRLKMLKKHIAVSRFEQKVQRTRYQFSDTLYMKELNIDKERIEDFVYYVFEDETAKNYVDQGDALGLLDFMMQKSKQYNSLREED
ncbi:MAG: hypothetical protein ABNH00_12690 [Dokdonia sp.]|jgi:hypothetical protein|nr:hypothetical protein [Cytophagaceae bacterium]